MTAPGWSSKGREPSSLQRPRDPAGAVASRTGAFAQVARKNSDWACGCPVRCLLSLGVESGHGRFSRKRSSKPCLEADHLRVRYRREADLGRRFRQADWHIRRRACWPRGRSRLTPISWQRLDVTVDGALVVVRHVTNARPGHRRQAGAGGEKFNPIILRVRRDCQAKVFAVAGPPWPGVRLRAPLKPL